MEYLYPVLTSLSFVLIFYTFHYNIILFKEILILKMLYYNNEIMPSKGVAMTKEIKEAVKFKLRAGMKAKDISEQTGVKLSTIYAIKRELPREDEEQLVKDMKDVPMDALHHVVDEAKKLAPTMTAELDAVVVSVDGIKKLDAKFQETIAMGLKRFDEMLQRDDLKISEVKTIMDTTANAYAKVFDAGTNIHIGDNNSVSSQQLTIFKNKMGA
jgi:hypothetical protein